MNILKIIIVLLVIFIITVYGLYYIREKKADENGEYIYNIINKSYNKIEEIQKGNYLLIEEYYVYDNNRELVPQKRVTFHKDKYFKKELHYNNDSLKFTDYGREDNSNLYYMQVTNNHIGMVGYSPEGKVRENPLYSYVREDVDYYRNWKIKEERYEGMEYYIISKEDYEIWINKDNMQIFKIVYFESNEHIYNWQIDCVTDEDVRLKNIDGYEIKDYARNFIDDYKLLD